MCTVHEGIYVSSYKLCIVDLRIVGVRSQQYTPYLIPYRTGKRRLKVLLPQDSSLAKSGMVGKSKTRRRSADGFFIYIFQLFK